MQLADLQYHLPPELVAQTPIEPRDASRLLVLERSTGRLTHTHFRELPRMLRAGDALVLNQTRVVPARFFARRTTGGLVEGLFLSLAAEGCWLALLKAAGSLRPGEKLHFQDAPWAFVLVEPRGQGQWLVRPDVDLPGYTILERVGRTPLPPYIKRSHDDPREGQDSGRYQTVYADQPGAVAAPTAGLHFTGELLDELTALGVGIARLTLHVGLGTFKPVTTECLQEHHMHSELYELPASAAEQINRGRASGGRIVCVGTTTVRTLETCAAADGSVHPGTGETDLFIYPPYRFKAVDVLLTNFHLPGSTLLALVFAFAGREATLAAYQQAIDRRYRFYSYGDAMLIL
ncbi:MAG TPA: tRNA preQ1(34) S-adenosylmethionine ribosyltransferase-isomerase QueA [Phycisphaerae bacterium]|nr:tRNA preQ1(34) S-adenosylmethionine ribosyltransferase-isomerase QueA [Phycisphaerae bacterium]